jgi:YVTN family beta-propeller protein
MMKTMFGFVVGSAALTISLSASASVSHVFVSNTGDETLSLIRCVTSNGKNPIKCQEKERQEVGFGTSWPANQYRGHPAWWWSGLSGRVIGIKAKASLAPLDNANNVANVDTYNVPGRPDGGANFIGIMPDGRTAWNSAREVDRIQEIDVDPDSPSFGTILTEIPVPDLDPSTPATAIRGAARPCDATISPDGRYFFEPDLAGESLTVVDTQSKEIIHQVQPPQVIPDEKVLPFMATTNGKIVLVENFEDVGGTYDIWDVSVLPAEPIHLKKLTAGDGLGLDAQTSEFTPDGRYAYLIMRGDPTVPADSPDASRIDVLDVDDSSPTYLEIVNSIELPESCFASTGDFSNDGRYFFVNCNRRDELNVIDNATQKVVASVPVGTGPRGVVVR